MLANFYNNKLIEAGCDEAGRGCLAGPVFAAAVILPKDFYDPMLNDSKKLTEKQRLALRIIIEEKAIDWQVAKVDNKEIDKINILNASIKAMHIAINNLKKTPEFLLIDGNKFKQFKNIPHKCIVKGDGKYASIAAASILSKTYRDEYMIKLSEEFPFYLWEKNKAYPTKTHRKGIEKHGLSPYHRLSFKLNPQLKIEF
ncbi:MAG: ribonuclease HII [Bacteroidetes bacterium HGW-Bacteroidetes-15]|nr:MAG: ribonuclease HII [Bacteroidetes bacterium HGW-Bacteroidetes-15]